MEMENNQKKSSFIIIKLKIFIDHIEVFLWCKIILDSDAIILKIIM